MLRNFFAPRNRLIIKQLRKEFHVSTMRPAVSIEKFEEAKNMLNTLPDDVGNDVKLKLYGLFKQATVGTCNTKKPSAIDFVGKAKWEAWTSLGAMSQEAARSEYVSLVESLVPKKPSASTGTSSTNKYEGFKFLIENNITKVIFSRPEKKNAITVQMYKDLVAALQEASQNDTSITVITGEGDYYSSGNDLSNFTLSQGGDIAEMCKAAAAVLRDFVAAFIDFPKPLVAVVNGPAVGIPVTLLGLFDAVYASDKATFYTPFSALGQSPEACATYTFPKIMGHAKACEMLLFNRKYTAQEAKEAGLVSEVISSDKFGEEVQKKLEFITSGSKNSMLYAKKLIRDNEKETLHKVNAAECERLEERWQSPDCLEALMKFFQRKGKL